MRELIKVHQLDHSFAPFTSALTKQAILRASNSTACGPDGLTTLHLKFLGPIGIAYLTTLYNLSVANANIPTIWKKAVIISISKPGKPADQSTGYQPISLLLPAVKVLERLLLPSFPVRPISMAIGRFAAQRRHSSQLSLTLPMG
jgi:hypothetical protein